jgi:hypothetical protein
MSKKLLGLLAISVLLSTVLVMTLSPMQDAEAKPASKSPKHKFSKWTGIVCGDELCPEKAFMKTKQQIAKSKVR